MSKILDAMGLETPHTHASSGVAWPMEGRDRVAPGGGTQLILVEPLVFERDSVMFDKGSGPSS